MDNIVNTYGDDVRFEWDPEKAEINLRKHRIGFPLAQRVWDDPFLVIVPDRTVDGEERFHAIGAVQGTVIVLVVHSYPDPDSDNRIRIISARKATPHERRRYEEES